MSGWSPRVWIAIWCGVAVALRLGVMLAAPEQLTLDRDLYLGIAQELRAGHGYATPGSNPPRPTAYRPPLYPLLLAVVGERPVAVGGLHLLLAAGMVVAVGSAAYRLASGQRLWVLAPALVAIDPLLLLYSRQPMTETLCACLSAILIWRVVCRSSSDWTRKSICEEGVLWGLCLLARPTYGAAMAIWLLVKVIRFGIEVHHGGTEARSESRERVWSKIRDLALVLTVTLLTLSPWAIRNWAAFGRPIVTTTHGGYTLWLANNPVYYSEVIEGSDSAWNGESLAHWQLKTDQELDQNGISGEIARDRALSQKARDFIRAESGRFMRACWDRAMSFWGIAPSRTDGNGQNLPILWVVGGYYLTFWVGGIAALSQGIRRRVLLSDRGVLTAISLIIGFFLVHLVYWTDVRMRAPIMPAVAVLIAAAFRREPLHKSGKPDE